MKVGPRRLEEPAAGAQRLRQRCEGAQAAVSRRRPHDGAEGERLGVCGGVSPSGSSPAWGLLRRARPEGPAGRLAVCWSGVLVVEVVQSKKKPAAVALLVVERCQG